MLHLDSVGHMHTGGLEAPDLQIAEKSALYSEVRKEHSGEFK